MNYIRKYPLIVVIFAAALVIRLILDSQFRNSASLYVLIPFLVSILLLMLIKRKPNQSDLSHFFTHMLYATVVMLGSSAILAEGFICVLMFMPIYFIFITLGFIQDLIRKRFGDRKNKKFISIIPFAVILLSLEGTTEQLSNTRYSEATWVKRIRATPSELQNNMALTINFPNDRHWFLEIFPLPTNIKAGTLKTGDIHTLDFVYKRWFFTNTHTGTMSLKINSVTENHITTEITENTSYLSNYMEIIGTEVHFKPIESNLTEVSLTVKYNRLLDPYWYFEPLQNFAAKQSAKLLIESIIQRDFKNTLRDNNEERI